jgi:hypothetical protein
VLNIPEEVRESIVFSTSVLPILMRARIRDIIKEQKTDWRGISYGRFFCRS